MPISRYQNVSALSRPGVCTSSTRPASPYEGQIVYVTDNDQLHLWNGSAWVCITPQAASATNQPAAASTTFTTLTDDPVVSIQTGTKALVTLSCRNVKLTSVGYSYTCFAISGATTRAAAGNESNGIVNYWGTNDLGNDRQSSSTFLVTGLTAGVNTFTMQHARDGTGNYFVTGRSLTVVGIP